MLVEFQRRKEDSLLMNKSWLFQGFQNQLAFLWDNLKCQILANLSINWRKGHSENWALKTCWAITSLFSALILKKKITLLQNSVSIRSCSLSFCYIPQYIQDPKQDIGYPVAWALSQKMYMKWLGSWLEHSTCSLNVNALLWYWSIHAMRWQESSVPRTINTFKYLGGYL